MRNKNQTGFTLIELLVVIAIIGLLASIVLLALNSARSKSRDAKRIADMQQMASALELYYNDNNAYPTATGQSTAAGVALYGDALLTTALVPKYVGVLPQAPTPQDNTCTATGGGGNAYWWIGNSVLTGTSYTMTFCLGGVTGGYSAGSHTVTPAGIQ